MGFWGSSNRLEATVKCVRLHNVDLSSNENIWSIRKHKKQQRRARTAEQLESYTRQEWNNIPPQRSKAPQFPGVYRLPLKEDRTLHSGKHGPVPTFFKRVTAIKFQISCKMSHFQHLKCFLCSNVSKITCHCTLFFFTFYSVPTFLGNWGCIFYFF